MIKAAINQTVQLVNSDAGHKRIGLMRYAGLAACIPVLISCMTVIPVSDANTNDGMRNTAKPNMVAAAPRVINRAALSGTVQKIDYYYNLNPDCSPEAVPVVRVVEAPAHGTITLQESIGYSAFSKDNQRYDCNKLKSPLVNVLYQSSAGYVGTDTAKIEVIFVSGGFKEDSFHIDVK